MILKKDVYRVVVDFFRTELSSYQSEALAVFEEGKEEEFFERLPREVRKNAFDKAALFFGYSSREFSSLALMTEYAYAAYLKNRRVVFTTQNRAGATVTCIHTENMLEEEASALVPFFKGIKRVVSLVPANHWYGFTFTITLPHILGIEVAVLPPLSTQSWEEWLQEGDLVVAFPLFWNYWLRAGNKFAPGVTALSSTAPCKDEIINRLFGAGLAHFAEVYGSSKTGSLAIRTHAGAPFSVLDFWEVSRRTDTPKFKRKSQPEWLMLPDELAFLSDRSIRVLRRKEDCVRVAGVKVYPQEIEQILSKHPAVKNCRVRLMRPDEGKQLKAFVVLKEGYTPAHESIIRTYLSQKLTVYEMPTTFTFGAQLPAAAVGKESNW